MVTITTGEDGSDHRLLDVHLFLELLNNGTEAEQDALFQSISAATPDELAPFLRQRLPPEGWTALMLICAKMTSRKSLFRFVRLLVQKGADYKVRNVHGCTILMFAAHQCAVATDCELLRYILQELDFTDCSMINAQTSTGWTALHIAGANAQAVELLLQHGADPSIPAKDDGLTPLARNAYHGNVESAAVLCRYGASVSAANGIGCTVLMVAAQYSTEVLRYFLQELDCSDIIIDAQDMQGWTALHWANENPQALELLLEHGANPNIRDNNGETPLHCATCNGNTVSVAVLLKYGASIRDVSNEGSTVWTLAARSGTEVLRCFLPELDCSDFINAQDQHGWTALHHARLHPQSVRLLLEHGANPHVRTKSGETPLYWVVCKGKTESAAMLWKIGASIADVDNHRRTVLMVAAKCSIDVLQYFLQELNCSDIVNAQDIQGVTALHRACESQHAVALLLEHGADPLIKDLFGSTPLDQAICERDNPEKQPIIDLLLRQYKMKMVAQEGDQCLHWILRAAIYNEGKVTLPVGTLAIEHMMAFLTLFVSEQANLISTIDDAGALPLHIACQCLKTPIQILEFLVEHDPSTVRQADHAGNLPIHRLCGSRPSLHNIKYLLSFDAESISTWNNQGRSPFEVAALASASVEVLRYLMKGDPAVALATLSRSL